MKKNVKREFAKKLEQTARELKEHVDSGEGRAYILIGSDRTEGDEEDGGGNTQTTIAAGGKQGQIIEALADFMAQDETAHIVQEAMKIALLKRLVNKLEPNN